MLDSISPLLPINVLALSALAAFFVYRYVSRNFNYWKDLNIPYVSPVPAFFKFLNAMTFRISLGDYLADFYREMKEPFFGIWVFGTPHLIVKDPELIKSVLLKDFDYFHDKTTFNDKHIDPIGSRMLFFERMPDWSSSRRTLTAAFSSGKLKAMIPLVNDCAKQMSNYISKQMVTDNIFEAKAMCSKFSVAVISSCAFGLEAGSFETESKFLECGQKMFGMDLENAIRSLSYFFLPSIAATFKLSFAKPAINAFLSHAFLQTIEVREKSGENRGDLVDVLIKVKQQDKLNGIVTDNNKLIAHAVQFFIAGSETTGSTISFTLYEMALDKNMQHKLRKDIQVSLEKHGGPTYEALMDMKYLTMCVSETLRKYPVLPFLDRRCMRDYPVPGSDVIIPKGTPVYIPMFGLHYDPNFFPDPERYDPDRFTDENVRGRHQFCYLPFGQGPHNCIGERFGLISTKLALIQILTNFEVERNDKTPVPVVFDPKSFLLMAIDGLPITIKKLEN